MELAEVVLVTFALLTAFGMGVWFGFARGFKFTMALAAPVMDLAKQAKSLLGGGGGKMGMWDVLLRVIQGGGLGGLLGGKK